MTWDRKWQMVAFKVCEIGIQKRRNVSKITCTHAAKPNFSACLIYPRLYD
jgi:hypothetical protein